MARGSDQANAVARAGVKQNAQLFGQGQGLYNTLVPTLASQMTNPQGMNPADMARAETANMETAGGENAAAQGEGALEETRTKNAGSRGMALAKAARESGKNLLRANLSTQLANQQLKEQQRERAQAELGGLYGTNVQGANQAAGEVAANVNANANQENASWGWAQNILRPVLGAASRTPL